MADTRHNMNTCSPGYTPMNNMIQHLQRTIKALETISDKGLPQGEQVDELLDQLFQQKIDLQNLSCSPTAPLYQQACNAFGHAAGKAERAAKDPTHLREMIPAVTEAIAKLAKLLNSTGS